MSIHPKNMQMQMQNASQMSFLPSSNYDDQFMNQKNYVKIPSPGPPMDGSYYSACDRYLSYPPMVSFPFFFITENNWGVKKFFFFGKRKKKEYQIVFLTPKRIFNRTMGKKTFHLFITMLILFFHFAFEFSGPSNGLFGCIVNTASQYVHQ